MSVQEDVKKLRQGYPVNKATPYPADYLSAMVEDKRPKFTGWTVAELEEALERRKVELGIERRDDE